MPQQPDPAHPSSGSESEIRRPSSLGSWARGVLFVCLGVSIAWAARAGFNVMKADQNRQLTEIAGVRTSGLVDPTAKGLAPQFTDATGSLLADPPPNPAQFLDPQALVVAHVESTDSESPDIPWDQFDAHLAKETGRKVVDMVFDDGPAQLQQIKDGNITIVALHAADAPFLVNNYGFQPAAVLGDEQQGANGNHLDIIVAPNSPIAHPGDLRGHSLVCTVPSSITGYRAAIVLLAQDVGLRPNMDYFVTWSLSQKKSITGVVHSDYEAAAISDDKLQTLLDKGTVDKTGYRVIYQSDVIPRTTIGWFFNLKPELAANIRAAILDFRPAGSDSSAGATTPPDDTADANGDKPLHFIAIDYKKDFALVRSIDNRFDPRLDTKLKTHPPATTQPAQASAD